MDGCSKQVVVLFGDSPTNENTFVAPSVYSLVKVDSKPAVRAGPWPGRMMPSRSQSPACA